MATTVKNTTKDVKVITFPQITVGEYSVITYPATCSPKSLMYAMVYNKEGKAIWETLSFKTVKQAQAAARQWIKEQ